MPLIDEASAEGGLPHVGHNADSICCTELEIRESNVHGTKRSSMVECVVNKLTVQNFGTGMLCLSIEPYGEDFWLRPDQVLTVVPSDSTPDAQFQVVAHDRDDQGNVMVVWINQGGDLRTVVQEYAVVDEQGQIVDCGYQRPQPIDPAGPGAASE